MIILDSTVRSLEVVLGSLVTTAQLPILACYVDIPAYTGVANPTVTNSTTPVTVVAAPLSGIQRQVKLLTVRNKDSASATVIVQYNNNTVIRELVKFTLLVDEVLVYTVGEGFRVLDANGAMKGTGPTGPAGPTGAQGPLGPPVFLVAEEPDSPLDAIPGNQGVAGAAGAAGASGATGAQGEKGPAVFLSAEEGEAGEPGPPGAAGSGSTFATPAIVLDTAAAPGVATTTIRSDSTIVAFDATAPSTQAFSDAAVVGVATVAPRRDHKHAMPANPVTAHNVASAIHGLGTGKNVLGNSDASGEFIQRGSYDPASSGASSFTFYSGASVTITFAVAFAATPYVMFAGQTTGTEFFGVVHNVTTTSFKIATASGTINDAPAAGTGRWVALGG